MRLTHPLALTLALGLTAAATVVAQRSAAPPASATAATTRIVAAAQALLGTLDDAGRAKVQFPFEGPQKTRWSNLPSPMFHREGLLLADLTPAQRTAVTNLLTVALSADGLRKVTDIMRGDEALKKNESAGGGRGPGGGGAGGRGPDGRGQNGRGPGGRGPGGPGGGGPSFGEDQYYLAFVGTPSDTAPWMLQFGGHHLAINLTLARQPGEHGAQPSRRATSVVFVRRPNHPSARATRTTRPSR